MGTKLLGRLGTHSFLFIFSGKNINLYILKGISPFKMYKIIFFSCKLETILGCTSKYT